MARGDDIELDRGKLPASPDADLPHQFLLRVVQGRPIPQHVELVRGTGIYELRQLYPDLKQRIRCASQAAPYFAPRLGRILADAGRSDGEQSFAELMAELAQALPQ